MTLCYIGIGSNLNDPLRQVATALGALANIPDTSVLRRSPWYRSPAVGPGVQPDYVNGVIELESTLTPFELLHHLQHIEMQQGRQRSIRWSARTLDLDILLYGDQRIETPELQIPHPRLSERNFVLVPLATLSPQRQLPVPCSPNASGVKNATIGALLAELSTPVGELQLLDGEREVVTL